MSVNIKEAAETLLELGMMPLVLTSTEEREVISEVADLIVSNLGTENIITYTKHFLAFAITVRSENFEFTLNCVGKVFLVKGMAEIMFTLPEWKVWTKSAWKKEKCEVTC